MSVGVCVWGQLEVCVRAGEVGGIQEALCMLTVSLN